MLADRTRDRRRHRGRPPDGPAQELARQAEKPEPAAAQSKSRSPPQSPNPPQSPRPNAVARTERRRSGAPGRARAAARARERRSRDGARRGAVVTDDLSRPGQGAPRATGAGMMDCKRALEETGGRHGRGDASCCARRASRRQRRGPAARPPRARSCSTSPRKASARWSRSAARPSPCRTTRSSWSFAQRVLEAVEKHGPSAASELEDERVELVGKLGENIIVRDAVRYEATDATSSAPTCTRRRTSSASSCTPAATATRPTAWQCTSPRPDRCTSAATPCPRRRSTPSARSSPSSPTSRRSPSRCARRSSRAGSRSGCEEIVLDEQPWIHETSKRVGDVLDEAGLEVIEFKRLAVAE